ncbi:hypothetical protein EDD17DRAFT_1507897 [Pisolithus thermaeus]|nr:hypothetical protein EV401DRAFT_1894898 [Pisolithus croceorrhizus]KAI6162431.1 hypothetical protein EDD17DRAFT_1507897 [Pisolithus thermaeus]
MHSVLIPTPPGTATAPHMDRMEAMCRATIPTPPAGSPAPHMDRMVAMCNATIPPPPACMPAAQTDKMAAMRSVAIPLPPVASAALPPQPLPINNLERMKMAVIPIPPSMAPAPAFIKYRGNVDHPQQSTSTEVTDSQRQPCMITGEDINQGEEPDHGCTVDFGDMPTLEECQALEWVELAMSDADDDFLHALHMFKSQHGAGFPPSNIPYDKDLDRHIISQVQHVEAGQYTVDMINLLEVLQHPHVGYSLQPYTGGPPYPSRQSVIEMAIVYLGCCIEVVRKFVLGYEGAGSPHTGDCIAGKLLSIVSSMFPGIPAMPRGPGFVFPWWVDRSPQYHAEFQQMRGTRIFPIAHEYFQHTWPLQQLSVGDQIDEWMEEKVSAYMIMVRSAAGWTYEVKYIMEFKLTDVHFATCNTGIAIIVPGLYQNRRLRPLWICWYIPNSISVKWKTYLYLPAAVHLPPVRSEPPGQKHTYKGGSLSMLPFRSAISWNNAMSVCHLPIHEGFMLSFSGTAILLSEFQICLWDEGEFPAMWEFQVSYLMFTI